MGKQRMMSMVETARTVAGALLFAGGLICWSWMSSSVQATASEPTACEEANDSPAGNSAAGNSAAGNSAAGNSAAGNSAAGNSPSGDATSMARAADSDSAVPSDRGVAANETLAMCDCSGSSNANDDTLARMR